MKQHPRSRARRLVRCVVAAALVAGSVTVGSVGAAPRPAAAAVCPAPGGVAVPQAILPAAEVVFLGHGFGHAIGMSQYGMQGAARLGCSYPTILETYYEGTTVTTRTMPSEVRLWMLRDGRTADTRTETGGVSWVFCAASCTTVAAQGTGDTWRTSVSSGRLRLTEGTTVRWTAPSSGTLYAKHSGSVIRLVTAGGSFVADRRMKWGETRYTIDASGDLQAVQAITAGSVDGVVRSAMDRYLFGLAEVPVTWPAEALKAQVTAARTYAARKLLASSTAVLYPSTLDQYYTGYSKEQEDAQYGHNWRSAVIASSGKVVVDGTGALATTMYSSSTGGYSEDARYSIGGSGATYLRAVDDSRWNAASDDPNRSWAVGFTRAEVAAALGFTSVSGVYVAPRGTTERWEDRVRVTGVRGGSTVTLSFDGNDVRGALGLKSPGFTVRMSWGGASAQPIAGDWDGDGRTDLGWFKNGYVALRWPDGTLRRFTFGTAGDVAVVGDWDGDGRDSLGVFRNGTWLLRNSLSTGAPSYPSFTWGRTGDIPLAGDWAGRGRDGIALMRGGRWYLRASAKGTPDADKALIFGSPGDAPLLGDWNANGTDTPGIQRVAQFYLRNGSGSGGTTYSFSYGAAGDRAIAGDWDGDGDVTVGVVRGTTWWLRRVSTGPSSSDSVVFAG